MNACFENVARRCRYSGMIGTVMAVVSRTKYLIKTDCGSMFKVPASQLEIL